MRCFRKIAGNLYVVVAAVLSLASCDHYMLDAKLDATQPPQPAAATAPPLLGPSSYYVSVVAQVDRGTAAPTQICAHSFMMRTVASYNDAVSMSALLPSNTAAPPVPIPLFTVNSDTSTNTCEVVYSERYILPHIRFGSGALYVIDSKYLYQTKGTGNISAFLTAGTALLAIVAPAAAPATATITAIASSSAGQTVLQLANSLSSGTTSIQQPLIDIDYGNPAKPVAQTKRVLIQQIPLDSSGAAQEDKAATVGVLTVTARQNLTVLGTEPSGTNRYPDYSGLTLQSPVVIFPYTNSQAMFTLLNNEGNAGRVDAVTGLTTAANVSAACSALRGAIGGLNLNLPDTTAYLWRAYSSSAYAIANEKLHGNQICLTTQEQQLIKAMKIADWLVHSS
jgi:hypothetical protein